VTPRALSASERGVLWLVGLGLVATGLVLFLPRGGPAPVLREPIVLSGTRVVAPTFLLEAPRVDLNTADAQALATLPGIGDVLAGRIIAYRAAHGPFRSLEELDRVTGIGEALIEGLRGAVTLGD